MAARVDIDDVSKLRPELLNLSLAELERREAELAMARQAIEQREAAKAQAEYEAKLAEARKDHEVEVERQLESAIDAVQKLHRYGLLKDETLAAATDSRGVFVASNLFKRKLPADWVPPGFGDVPPLRRSASGAKKQARKDILSSKGEKPIDAISALISKSANPLTADQVLSAMANDTGFAPFVKTSPKSFTGALSFLVRKGVVVKDGDTYKKG